MLGFPRVRRLRRLVVGLCLTCVCVASLEALADDEQYSLVVAGPEGCVTRDSFLDEVKRRTSRFAIAAPARNPDVRFDVAVAKKGEGLVATLVIDRGGTRATRKLEGQTCEEVVGALSFMVALTVDPLAKAIPDIAPTGPGPTPSASMTASAPAPSASTPPVGPAFVMPPRPAWARIPYAWGSNEGPSAPLPALASATPSEIGFGVGASFRVDGALFSVPLLGAEIGGYVHGGNQPWLVGASAAIVATPSGTFGAANGQLLLGLAQITGCPWGGIFGPVTLRPCATVSVGGLSGDFEVLGPGLGGFVALNPEARVAWAPAAAFALEAALRLVVPLVSPRFVAGSDEVVEANKAGISAVMGGTFLP